MMESVSPPVISLRPPRHNYRELTGPGDAEELFSTTSLVQQIEASFRSFGCICVPVTDLDAREGGEELLRRCYDTAERFFCLPKALKEAYIEEEAARQGFGGSCYTPFGKEPAYVEGEKQLVESFSCTRPLDPEAGTSGHAKLHCNLFPDSHVPRFGEAFSSMWEALREAITLPVMSALEEMLCLPRGFFLLRSAEVESVNTSLLRTLRYPAGSAGGLPCERPRHKRSRSGSKARRGPVEVGISEHTDFELVTVMHQDSPGLWLKSPCAKSCWYQPTFRRDVFTVILGDMAELWTAGWLRATPHKVSSPDIGEGPRKSLVLFQAHDDLVRVCPLIMDQLNENRTETTSRAEEGLQGRSKYRRRLKIESERCPTATTVGQQIPSQCSFIEWVRHRPRAALRKYRSTTQGAWIRGQELKAKSTLLNSVGN